VAAEPGETWELRVSVKDKVLKRQTIGKGDGGWEEHVVDLSAFKGTTIRFRFEAKAAGGKPKACYWSDIDLSATK
jgi:Na+-translocating ferredoxin:NAD+ oxidoreductase RnfC subunit